MRTIQRLRASSHLLALCYKLPSSRTKAELFMLAASTPFSSTFSETITLPSYIRVVSSWGSFGDVIETIALVHEHLNTHHDTSYNVFCRSSTIRYGRLSFRNQGRELQKKIIYLFHVPYAKHSWCKKLPQSYELGI